MTCSTIQSKSCHIAAAIALECGIGMLGENAPVVGDLDPAFSWNGKIDGRDVSWTVWSTGELQEMQFVQIVVGQAHARRHHDGKWRLIADDINDAAECVRLCQAAERGI